MKGSFLPGDFLHIDKVHLKDLKKGDVIVFNNINENSEKIQVVHRVTKILKDQIITRGDNNKRPDINPVTKSNLIGKVGKFERNGKIYNVLGGSQGLFIARSKFYLRTFLFGFYKKAIKNRVFKRAVAILLRYFNPYIKIISLKSPEGEILKWIYKNRVIAQKGPKKNYFYCKKPFDLIIEKRKQEVRSQEIEERRKNSH